MEMLTFETRQAPSALPFVMPEVESAWVKLQHLEETNYPGFRAWFWGTMAPALEKGTRRLFVRGADGIDGLVIAKNESGERKLCTIWVAQEARGLGIATDLIDEATDWLADARPLVTIPQERLMAFEPIIASRGFEVVSAITSLYRPGKVEYVINRPFVPSGSY